MASSSSKKKSSFSSHKKKPSKKLSLVKRKKSKSSKKEKSKKLRRSRRDVSVSHSDDDSRTDDSVYISSSGSEEDNRSRKTHSRSRSRTRGVIKGSKKRRWRSPSSESPRRKKKEAIKRVGELKEKKKTSNRKHGNGRSHKKVSVDSGSNDSRSCSTCYGESSSGESDSERSRGRYEGGEKKVKRSSDRTSGGRNYHGYESEERLASEKNPPRLRSVLSIVKGSEEEVVRDEIIQASDDCPSSRSNDSYDGGRKGENKIQVGGAKIEKDDFTSKTTKFSEICKDNTGVEHVECNPILTMGVIRSEVSVGVDSSKFDDWESILRQKALENLRKFRGNPRTNQEPCVNKKSDSSSRLENLSNAKTDSIEIKPLKETVKNNAEDRPLVAQSTETTHSLKHESKDKYHATNPLMGVKKFVLDRTLSGKTNKESDPKSAQGSSTLKQETFGDSFVSKKIPVSHNSPQGRLLKTTYSSEKYNNEIVKTIHRISNSSSTFKRGTFGDRTILKKAPASQSNSLEGRLSDIKNIPEKSSNETPKAANSIGNTIHEEVNKNVESVALEASSAAVVPEVSSTADVPEASSAAGLVSEAFSSSAVPGASAAFIASSESNQSGDVIKGGSQFEQKTMSVMRGGDLVKVNYKVYIPRKTPALARRQLQR
ncbi:hypothetical protein GIB67_000362 [Kingdonia uniflora]|uniref:Uncharacterized protein n=1 Tax=Kingdonia uniflora TaxID=39325 RepID=A0A7J7LKP6_9MAGN|nr:hypothetical protein GIB67_000362 [Kingdonia uniflora]